MNYLIWIDMEVWNTIGSNLLLTIAGLALYSLWKVRDKIKVFDFAKFIKDNKGYWAWAICLQAIFALLIGFFPEAPEAIKALTGLDYGVPMAFFSTGYMLAGLANGMTKDKIGTVIDKK